MEIDGSPNTITTKTSIARKIRSKEYAHSLKTGSPKLRDLMRQVCKCKIYDLPQKPSFFLPIEM